jgi:hypothetical protein
MRTIIELPDPIYQKGERVAKAKGLTLQQLIIGAVERELAGGIADIPGRNEVALPLIHSRKPCTLDLSNFDFDDLLT